MLKFFLELFGSIPNYVGVAILIYLVHLIFAFVPALILAICKVEYGLKKRLWFFLYSVSLNLLFVGAIIVLNQSAGVCVMVFAITLLIDIPILIIRKRQPKPVQTPKELIRLIDKEIYMEEKTVDRLHTIPVKEEVSKDLGLNFTHVKSVISKLEYYPLTPSDKKQVRELESAVYTAENLGFTTEIKEKINDGLGGLLKIMSKYGV